MKVLCQPVAARACPVNSSAPTASGVFHTRVSVMDYLIVPTIPMNLIVSWTYSGIKELYNNIDFHIDNGIYMHVMNDDEDDLQMNLITIWFSKSFQLRNFLFVLGQ